MSEDFYQCDLCQEKFHRGNDGDIEPFKEHLSSTHPSYRFDFTITQGVQTPRKLET